MRVLAIYGVLKSQSDMVWIVDHDGARTITNDAEAVCAAVHAEFPGRRIIYRDTAGYWDELVHDEGIFLTFAPARDLAPTSAA